MELLKHLEELAGLLKSLDGLAPYVEPALYVIGGVLGLIAMASVVYTAERAAKPFLIVLRWLFAYTPGEKPNDIVAGISCGARILAWSAIIALVVWLLLGDFLMANIVGQEQRGRMFTPSMLATIAIGVGVVVWGIFHFRAAKPVQEPAEIRTVEEPVAVPAKQAAVEAPKPPPPAPKTVSPPPPPAPKVELVKSPWEGVWRQPRDPHPVFRISHTGEKVSGTCDVNPRLTSEISTETTTSKVAEFTVEDQVFRVHIRMTIIGKDRAKVEQWVSADDLALSVQRAQKLAKTPQQKAAAKQTLLRNATVFRFPKMVGIFNREGGG